MDEEAFAAQLARCGVKFEEAETETRRIHGDDEALSHEFAAEIEDERRDAES
jgi:hypothetical protein